MTTKRKRDPRSIHRSGPLSDAERRRLRALRQQLEDEKPEIVEKARKARQSLMDRRYKLQSILKALRDAREAQGLSLADVKERTGLDRGTLSKLENADMPNVTLTTVLRYAEGIGKQVEIQLVDD